MEMTTLFTIMFVYIKVYGKNEDTSHCSFPMIYQVCIYITLDFMVTQSRI